MNAFDDQLIDLKDKSILITGGTGSFGKAFVRKICESCEPKRVVIYSRDEQKQEEMDRQFPSDRYGFIRYFIGDVRDAERLMMAMRGIDYVVHAAALKIVPTAEYNPFECVKTNIMGAQNVVVAAIQSGVKKVLALSTDKAANPVNLYGATKLASDKIFVAGNSMAGGMDTRFSVVRYGNVIGSRGSVVPLFKKLIEEKTGHLPLTDERMTRFLITLEQAVHFVLSCFSMMQGGEIFVPKIPSVLMPDLARAMAPELPHKIIGIRPGEKLHELMIAPDDARSTMELEDRYVIEPQLAFWQARRHSLETATRVPETFCYASNTNQEWLKGEPLAAFIREHG